MKTTLWLLATLWVVTPTNLSAQALTPEEAVRAALARHPGLAAARAEVERAAAGVRAAESERWPSFALETGATRFAEPMVVAPLHGFDPQSPPTFDRLLVQGSASVSWALLDPGRAPRADRARAFEAAARISDEGARQALIAETLIAYLDAIATRDRVMAYEARVAAMTRERDRAGRLFETGRAAHVLVLRAEAALAASRAEEVAARGEAAVAERSLARLIGEDPESLDTRSLVRVRLSAGAQAVDPEQALAWARDANPGIEAGRRQVEAAEAGAAEAGALRWPRIELTGRFIEYAAAGGLESGEWQGGLRFSYPLFTGGARGAAIDRARAEMAGVRAQLASAELDIANAVDALIARLNAAGERVAALESAVAQSEEVVRIERLALDAGAGVQTDYLSAEADLLAVRSALTDARRAFLSARIELARVNGQLTEAWLVDHLEPET
ncbi:MAG: TolC family protein [Gemmatimonadetes bacterium]|nr:TolC family protein [Gemmatimonadota bacterium]